MKESSNKNTLKGGCNLQPYARTVKWRYSIGCIRQLEQKTIWTIEEKLLKAQKPSGFLAFSALLLAMPLPFIQKPLPPSPIFHIGAYA
jgi:hypothetical protein